jgi:hypothetical protein
MKVAKSPEVKQLLQLGQAGAKVETGRAYMMEVMAERYREMASAAMAQANKAAGISGEGAATAPGGTAFAGQATRAFDDASGLLDHVFRTVPSGVDMSTKADPQRTIKWLTLTLQAVDNHGKYAVSNNPDDLKKAKDAAAAAMALNPFLQLGTLAEGSSGAGGGETAPALPPKQ